MSEVVFWKYYYLHSLFSSSDKGYITVETEEILKKICRYRLINGFWKLYYLKLAKSVAKFVCLHVHTYFVCQHQQSSY